MRPPEVNLGFPYIHTEGREGRRRRGGRREREAWQVHVCIYKYMHMHHTHVPYTLILHTYTFGDTQIQKSI